MRNRQPMELLSRFVALVMCTSLLALAPGCSSGQNAPGSSHPNPVDERPVPALTLENAKRDGVVLRFAPGNQELRFASEFDFSGPISGKCIWETTSIYSPNDDGYEAQDVLERMSGDEAPMAALQQYVVEGYIGRSRVDVHGNMAEIDGVENKLASYVSYDFPETRVNVGSEWSGRYFHHATREEVRVPFKLTDFVERGNRVLAVIAFSYKYLNNRPGETTGGILNSTSSTVYIDVKSGVVVESNSSQTAPYLTITALGRLTNPDALP